MTPARRAGSPAAPIAVAVAGLAVLGLGQGIVNRHAIEDDLTASSQRALQSASIAGVRVSFTGRDADLVVAGTPAEARRAKSVVEGVRGVRVASAGVAGGAAVAPAAAVPPPAPAVADPVPSSVPAAPPPSPAAAAASPGALSPGKVARPGQFPIGLTFDGGVLTLTGSVPSDEAATQVVTAAKRAAFSWKIVNQLEVNTALAPARQSWFPALTRLIDTVPSDGSRLVVRYEKDHVIMRGTPATAELERSLLAAGAATVGSTRKVMDGMDIPAAAG